PPDQIMHVLGRSLEAEAEGRGQDAQLKGPGDEVLKHRSSLRNATSLGRAASGAPRLKRIAGCDLTGFYPVHERGRSGHGPAQSRHQNFSPGPIWQSVKNKYAPRPA